jgi:hypothetical protein
MWYFVINSNQLINEEYTKNRAKILDKGERCSILYTWDTIRTKEAVYATIYRNKLAMMHFFTIM